MTETSPDLRYLDPEHTAVAGTVCEGMTVCNETGVLGQFKGFLVDPVANRLRFVVIELLGRLRMLPVATARVDLDHRAIELLECNDIRFSKPFRPELFRAFSADEALTTIFGRPSPA